MSQRGRPSSSQSLNDPQRMPFEAAEALLWGKKTHDEHKFLFPRMRNLEEQHSIYDQRIQATEAVAEAAEAATARIIRVEQKVAAIESDEQDRPFDKWVEGEVTGFKGFIEKNKSVRHKQIELENKVYVLEEVVDSNRDAHRDVQILLERIARLENERINDSKKLQRLEIEVERLAQQPQERRVEYIPMNDQLVQNPMPAHQVSPPVLPKVFETVDAAEETEDEELLPEHPFEQPVRQNVLHPPRESSPTIALPTSPQKGKDSMSARLRMMQRNSIYEPKQSRNADHRARGAAASLGGAFSPIDDSVPPTQIIDRRGVEGRGPTENMAASPPTRSTTKSLIVRLKTQKLEVEKATPIARVTRSQARKIKEAEQTQPIIEEHRPTIATFETQLADEPAAKRRKLNDTRASTQARPPKAGEVKKAVAKPSSTSRKPAKASPQKTAIPTKHDGLASHSKQSPEMNTTHALNVATSPQKMIAVQPKATGKASKILEAPRLDDVVSTNSHKKQAVSNPRKKNTVQPKATSMTSRAKDPVNHDESVSTSSRTLDVASSPRKKKAVASKAASKASGTMYAVPSNDARPSGSRLVSPKKTYSKSKMTREVVPEVRHDTYEFTDNESW